MKLDPRHLEILAAIVDGGGVSEGAALLGKSQPSVSRSLSMLEERVGITLFEPNRRPLVPTQFCLILAQEGRKVLEAGRAASKAIQNAKEGRSGAVRLMGTPIFMDGVISRMLAQFQADYSDVRLDQTYGYSQDVIEGVINGTVDIGILPIRNSDIPSGCSFTQILPGRNVIACRIGHPLLRKGALKISEIGGYPWIAPPANSPLYHDLRAVLEGIGVQDFKVSFTGGSLSAVTNILSSSDSLTVLPYSVMFNLRKQNQLGALSVRIGDPDRNLGVLVKSTSDSHPAHARLTKFIISECTSLLEVMQHREQTAQWR